MALAMQGCIADSDPAEKQIPVDKKEVPGVKKPIASRLFAIIPIRDTGYIGEKLVFTFKILDTSVKDHSVEWTNGDSSWTVDTLRTSFLKTGTHSVIALLKDRTGKVLDTIISEAHVQLYPFIISPDIIESVATLSIPFSVQARHTNTLHLRYEWHFGNGGVLSTHDDSLVYYPYPLPGDYKVKVRVFEESTNNLYGESNTEATAVISAIGNAYLASLETMNFIHISFSGFNTVYVIDKLGNHTLKGNQNCHQIFSMTGGDTILSSPKRIVWQGPFFKSKDSTSVKYNGKSSFDALAIEGEINSSLNQLDISASHHFGKSEKWENTNGCLDWKEDNETVLDFKTVPIAYISEDTITFSYSGQIAKYLANKILDLGNYFYYYCGDAPRTAKSTYLSTDWQNSQYVPTLTVAFYR